MVYILENLGIGDYDDALDPPAGIEALLCVAQEKDIRDPQLPYHKVPILDMQPIPAPQLRECIDWIRDHIWKHRIMVFCNAGIGRSPSVIVGYFCCILGYSFGHAVEYVATIKPYMSILPNLIMSIAEVKAQIEK